MSKSRRNFLTQTSLGILGAAVGSSAAVQLDAGELSLGPRAASSRRPRPLSAPAPPGARKSPPPPSRKPKNSSK